MSNRAGWYKTGQDGGEEAVKRDKEMERKREEMAKIPSRFWMAPDSSTNTTFLDSEGLGIAPC